MRNRIGQGVVSGARRENACDIMHASLAIAQVVLRCEATRMSSVHRQEREKVGGLNKRQVRCARKGNGPLDVPASSERVAARRGFIA